MEPIKNEEEEVLTPAEEVEQSDEEVKEAREEEDEELKDEDPQEGLDPEEGGDDEQEADFDTSFDAAKGEITGAPEGSILNKEVETPVEEIPEGFRPATPEEMKEIKEFEVIFGVASPLKVLLQMDARIKELEKKVF